MYQGSNSCPRDVNAKEINDSKHIRSCPMENGNKIFHMLEKYLCLFYLKNQINNHHII